MATRDLGTKERITVAFLGPSGTYSHQAAHEVFGSGVTYVAQEHIIDVFSALSSGLTFGVIPQENSIFGHVVETYDRLRHHDVGTGKFVCGEISLGVQHCLLVRRGVELHQITKLLSHEQALGQCRGFKALHLPNAIEIKMSSTAAAAEALLLPEYSNAGAICSKLCASLFDGIIVLRESIQDRNDNYTRFFILSSALDKQTQSASSQHRALLRLQFKAPSSPGKGAATSSNILPLLVALQIPIIRIDRRPPHSGAKVALQDIYFIEIQHDGHAVAGRDETFRPSDWEIAVESALKRVQMAGGEIDLLGFWSL